MRRLALALGVLCAAWWTYPPLDDGYRSPIFASWQPPAQVRLVWEEMR